MTKPETQTLYVMQNEFGLIKIGRSLDPERRRRSLQSDERCSVALVVSLTGQGHREEVTHLSLSDHLIEGEWFKGTADAQEAISALLPEVATVEWPFHYDAVVAEAWLQDFFDRRDRRSIRKQFYRMLNVHVRGGSPGYGTDVMIGIMLSELAGENEHAEPSPAFVRPVGASKPQEPLNYSTDVRVALNVWPEDCRPASWNGSALECAIAALEEHYRRLPP